MQKQLENINDHVLQGISIDVNPTAWKLQLAQRWVEHAGVDNDDNEYDLEQAYVSEDLPKHYQWMSTWSTGEEEWWYNNMSWLGP